ncbi:hypothetical protein BDV06DRAFT_85420 [Aspergillus oleicola]
MRSTLYFFGLVTAQLIVAEQVGYFESDDCADPDGFASCYDDADSWYNDCINDNCEGQNVDCQNSCEYARQGSYTRCQVGHCWNMVYTCEYQLQAADSVNSGINPDLHRVPFFPAPDNANGRCSCSIGHIVETQVQVNEVISQCGDAVDPFSQSADDIEAFGKGCLCCGISGLLSTLDAFCPKLDPTELEMDDYEQTLSDSLPSIDWPNCKEWLNQYDCAADFGFPTQISYYGPSAIPTGGTETLYNIEALTTPVSETVTFTIGGTLFPITAVSTDSSSVPTDLSNGDGIGSDNSSSGNSSNDNGSDNNSNESAGGSQSDSDNGDSSSGDVPEDAANRQSAVSSTLFLFVAATLGLAYIL